MIVRNRALTAAVLGALGLVSSGRSALGVNVYWDINGTSADAGATGGVASGTWDGVNTFWNDDATGGAGGTLSVDPTAANTAVFSAGSDATGLSVVNIPASNTRVVGGIQLEDGNVNVVGSGIISMPNTNTIIDVPTAGSTLSLGINANPVTIDSSGTITKTGAGIYFNNGANAAVAAPHFTGKWIIQGGLMSGVLNGNTANQLGVNPSSFVGDIITLDGGGIRTTNSSSSGWGVNRGITIGAGGGTFDLFGAGSVSFNGKITGTAGITVTGTGIGFAFADNSATYSGKWTLKGGEINPILSGTDKGFGTIPLSNVSDGVTLDGGAIRGSASYTLSATRGIFMGPGGGKLHQVTAGTLTVNSVISGNGNSGTLTLATDAGTGTAINLTAANTYTSPTVVTGSNGVTNLSGSLASASVTVNTGGTLNVSGAMATNTALTASGNVNFTSASQTIASLNGGGAVALNGPTALTVGGGTFSGGISGGGSLAKNTSGTTLLLSGTNTYTGNTTVSAGILLANSTASLPGYNVAGKVSATGTGTLAVSAGGAGQWVSADVDTVLANATLTSAGFGINVDATNSFTYNSNITQSVSFTKLGGGTLVLGGSNTYNGNTIISGGTLSVSAPPNLGAGNNVTLDGGTLQTTAAFGNPSRHILINATGGTFDSAGNDTTWGVIFNGAGAFTKTGAGTLKVTRHDGGGVLNVTGGTLAIKPTGGGLVAGTSKVDSISISGGGRFDLSDNKLIATAQGVGTWNGSAYDGVTGLIAAGYSPSQDFSGSGIVTTQSNATGGNTLTNIGVASNADLGLSTFGGVTVGANDALVMYTYGGDANLDGAITGDDYFQIDSGFPAGAHGWFNGDFNYDGSITGDDYFVIDSNFSAQGAPFPTGGGIAGVTAVPEPASLGFLAIAVGALLGRRRRQ